LRCVLDDEQNRESAEIVYNNKRVNGGSEQLANCLAPSQAPAFARKLFMTLGSGSLALLGQIKFNTKLISAFRQNTELKNLRKSPDRVKKSFTVTLTS
jgi:hypothetical protein